MNYRNTKVSEARRSNSTSMPEYNKTYIAKIKDNRDVEAMGRLRVWIPELSQRESDEAGWFTVGYCSPFAGATPEKLNTNEDTYEATQKSYGWWFVPPDLDNLVLVTFASGSTSLGFWIGCVYQDQMNNMVPGIGGQVSEYNKKTSGPKNPKRPSYSPLSEGIDQQGLSEDYIRGTSTSSARRQGDHGSSKVGSDFTQHLYNPSKANGILTPGGHQLVLDDGSADGSSKFIRLRTTSGAQILLSESDGMIYLINRDGSAWFELSPTGNIDAYSDNNISLRCKNNINLIADKNINIEAGNDLNIKTRSGNMKFESNGSLDMYSTGIFRAKSDNSLNLSSESGVFVSSSEIHTSSESGTFITGGSIDLSGGSALTATASVVTFNGPGASSAESAESAVKPSTNSKPDVSGTVTTIASRMPTHEPYPEHDKGVPPDGTAVDTDVYTQAEYESADVSYTDAAPIEESPIVSSEVRGLRNNNPLNIRIGNSWKGEREVKTDPSFEEFIDPSYGLRAAGIILRNYRDKYGLFTLSELIERWAPHNENDTNSYINFVSSRTGFAKDRIISEADLPKMMSAMIEMENGSNPYSISFIYSSINIA